MRLLIDTNVIIDVLQNREPYVSDSLNVWRMCETEGYDGYVLTPSFANLVYVMRGHLNPEKISEILRSVSFIFRLTDLTGHDLVRAAEMKWKDYEDALQSAAAERIHADYIITRNAKDFAGSRVKAVSPAELIAEQLEQYDSKAALKNTSVGALLEAQKAFEGVAEEQGISDEQDVADMVKEIRQQRRRKDGSDV